jgi:hypothetical protein
MHFSIVFKNTGDSIPFTSIYPDVVEYYVDYLDKNNLNSFATDGDHGRRIQQAINDLKNTTIDINHWIDKLIDRSIPIFTDEEYLNQHNLNQLHADWVNSQYIVYNIQQKRNQYPGNTIVEKVHDLFPDDIQFPTIGTVLSNLKLSPEYSELNLKVHNLEQQFNNLNFKIAEHPWVQFSNPFDQSILTNNLANLRLSFCHLGRTLYNKYQTFDTDLQCNDENSFNELLGFVSLHLVPPQTIPLSKEYTDWCVTHNKKPSGDYLNIGNIPDLKKHLKDYRLVVFRNLLQYNSFTINLTERH